MYTIHEGEIVFKEKYGSTETKRVYVKPPDQTNVHIHDENRVGNIFNIFSRIFLPQGYPDSVSSDYLSYQKWDTAQAFCSTITGTLATQEILRGVGVGNKNATPLAATITWVLKDGCGHIGKILFAYSHGSYLDAYSKKWRLYADTLNDAAMCMEIALPLYPNYTTLILCFSTVIKAIVGVAGGATRAAMTQHHAIRGNLGDVSAKDSAQETAVNLVGSVVALFLISMFGSSALLFGFIMVLHIIFNYFAVRSICLKTLNEPRYLQVIDGYLREEVIFTPCEINLDEPIVFYQLGTNLLDLKLSGFRIKLGQSMKGFIKQRPKAQYMKKVLEVYDYSNYILFPNANKRIMYVVLRDKATATDILCGYFHAVLLAIVTCAINDVPLAVYKHAKYASRPFAQVCTALHGTEWSREMSALPNAALKYSPSIELMLYVDKIVQKEWHRFKMGLVQTGWDVKKHLLVVDEWRICSARVATRSNSINQVRSDLSLPKSVSRNNSDEDIPLDVAAADTYTIEPEKKTSSNFEQSDDEKPATKIIKVKGPVLEKMH